MTLIELINSESEQANNLTALISDSSREEFNEGFRRKGVPLKIGFAGERNYECGYYYYNKLQGTERCKRPEHIEAFIALPLNGGRGIAFGCTTCPLFNKDSKQVEFE